MGRRRKGDPLENYVRLGIVVLVGGSLFVGGLEHFAGTLFVILAIVASLAAFAGLCILIIRCRLASAKKWGFLLLLCGAGALAAREISRPPESWPRIDAPVVAITGTAAETDTTYSFHAGRQPSAPVCSAVKTRAWPSLEQARRYRPANELIYYNPANPAEYGFRLKSGWSATTARPERTLVREVNLLKVRLNVGGAFAPKYVDLTGPAANAAEIGRRVTVYQNPLRAGEYSLEVKKTGAKANADLLWLGCVLCACGIVPLATGGKWGARRESVTDASGMIVLEDTPRPEPMRPSAPPEPPPPPDPAERLRSIDWFQFEKVVKRVLEFEGWRVQHTGGSCADGGVDLVAERNGRRIVVQCKHWHHRLVKVPVVRELFGAMKSAEFHADGALVATLVGSSQEAAEFARNNGIEQIDERYLLKRIGAAGIEHFPELMNPEEKFCPKCNRPLQHRYGGNATWECDLHHHWDENLQEIRFFQRMHRT
jgi:hypothetical protein